MKIKTKLLFLILALITAVLISIMFFVGLQSNISNLEEEQNYLKSLDGALQNELYELSSFFHIGMRFKDHLIEYREALESKQEAMSNLEKIKYLRSLSNRISDSLDVIENLALLQENNLVEFNDAAE